MPSEPLPDIHEFERRLKEIELHNARALVTVALIDIDGMTRLNQTLGIEASDRVLSQAEDAMRAATHSPNEMFRYRDDALAFILPESDMPAASEFADRLRELVLASTRPRVSVSAGVAEMTAGHDVHEVILKTELALSRAQESGGNRTWRADDPRRHGLNPVALSQELTDREWMIMSHLVRRRTEHDIAERMGIKAGTVRSHKARIRRKLHVNPDARLTDFATEHFSTVVDEREKAVLIASAAEPHAPGDLRVVIDLRE